MIHNQPQKSTKQHKTAHNAATYTKCLQRTLSPSYIKPPSLPLPVLVNHHSTHPHLSPPYPHIWSIYPIEFPVLRGSPWHPILLLPAIIQLYHGPIFGAKRSRRVGLGAFSGQAHRRGKRRKSTTNRGTLISRLGAVGCTFALWATSRLFIIQ